MSDENFTGNVIVQGVLVANSNLVSQQQPSYLKEINVTDKVTVGGKLAAEANLTVAGFTYFNGAMTANQASIFKGDSTFHQDVSLNGNFSVGGDLSLNGNVLLDNDLSLNGYEKAPRMRLPHAHGR